MTSAPTKYALVRSRNEVSFGFPYNGPRRATLWLRIHSRWGREVLLTIDCGQFHCPIHDCYATVRYDEGRAWQYLVTKPSDGNSTTLFLQDYGDIVASLRKSKIVRIEAEFYQEGPRTFEFDVSGLK